MTVADLTPDELAPSWGEDAIYSEAVCHVDDVYYEGSEDEKYPDSATRKLRYEASGRRYLEGHIPFLLSASLRGPFDEESGWVNPWRSKQRATTPKSPSPILTSKEAPPPPSKPITQAQRGLINDNIECHLPSPESLKQATVAEPYPYLEEDELAIMQRWRKSIRVPSPSQESFWTTTEAQLTTSAKKRRAKSSEWLKRVANKKRKSDSSDPSLSKSPLVRRNLDPRVSPIGKLHGVSFGSSFHVSPKRDPGRSFISSQQPKSRVQWHSTRDDEDNQTEQDELMTSTPDASFGSAHGSLASTPKRISPRRDMWRSAVLHITGSEDELSQNEAAAATLSSPVSQRREGQPTCTLNPNAAKQKPTASIGTQTSTPNGKQSNNRSEVQRMVHLAETDEQHDEAMQNGSPMAAADFETQQDQVVCFRMHTHAKPETAGGLLRDKADQQVVLSLPRVAWAPNASSEVPSPSPHAVDGTIIRDARQGGADAHSIQEAEQNETTHEPDLQYTMQQSADDHEVQMRLNFDHIIGNRDSIRRNVSKIRNRQANSPLPPVQLVQENSPATAEPETGIDVSSTLPTDASREPDRTCLDSTPENDRQRGIDHAATQDDAVPTPDAGHVVPAGAETELERDHHTNCSPGPVVSSNGSIYSQTVETAETVTAPECLDECVRPVDADDVPMEEASACPANKHANDFSFKNILHRLIPSSPWTRLSQLTMRSVSSTGPAANVEGAADENLVDTCCDFDARDDANEADSASPCSLQSFVNEQTVFTTAGAMEVVLPSQPSLEADPAEAVTEPRRDHTPDNIVFEDAMETNETAHVQETSDNIRITESQQSPWTKTELSQRRVLPAGDAFIAAVQVSPYDDAQACYESQCAIPPEAQSPWSGGAHIVVVDAGPESAMLPHEAGCNVEEDGSTHSQASQSEPRPSTPEPRFAFFKSFTSFTISPSPERTRRQTSHKQSQESRDSLSSAMKGPWSNSRTDRRVSWAFMPPDPDDDTQAQTLEWRESRSPSSRSMIIQGSPPPATPIGELPTSEDSKFNKHFAAVASRTNDLRQKLIPTASQQVAQSPGLHGMAETFLAADAASNDTEAAGEQAEEPGINHDTADPESQKPMDVVEDMFREMGDFLQVWDVEVELDRARTGAQQVRFASQSPW
ncbi:Uncharacterized protein TCAP_00823 [Tolypocladium capitatum]|uniref:Protamine P1 n=1 Tax=Tolypocladium capitatum TaxID=45235 RepID=A0A2K3QNZ7_9HYPO|nr:Uncharacterized protein TCAP_00823 [Tolypocladium capitatum]